MMLELDHITCRKGAASARSLILNEISFSIDQGEFVTLLGPSGSGKSTLLRAIILLEEYESGRIRFAGQDVKEWPVSELRRRASLVLQLPHLFALSVKENLLYGPTIHHRLPSDPGAFAAGLLERVGLPVEFIHRGPEELSVGQQMRVSLARSLANDPDLLLLDEPTASLDPASARQVLQLVQHLNRVEGLTVLLVIHDVEAALALGARSLFLHQGRLCYDGSLHDWSNQAEASLFRDYRAGVNI